MGVVLLRGTRVLTPGLLAGFAAIVVVLVAARVVNTLNLRNVYTTSEAVAHTHTVKDVLQQVLTTAVDAETGERGFIITGTDSYLEPYDRARSSLAGNLAQARMLMADNREQQADLDRLSALANMKLGELAEAIDRRRQVGFAAAEAVVTTNVGKRTMDEMRSIVARMAAREDALLSVRTAQATQSYRSGVLTGFTTTGLALLAVVALFFVTRRFGVERLRTAEVAERLRVTLTSIGDAVIATDEQGRVVRLNAVAERLTGWTENDAVGRRLEEVFVIINEDTRRPAENPIGKVLRDNVIVGLANHTVLIAKDGREIPVDDSAAPIRTADGVVTGVILVFRDVTERRQVERERVALLEKEQAARTESERVAEELRQLQSITDTALAHLDRESLVREVLTRVRAALHSDTATMLLLDPGGTHLIPAASEGLPEELGKAIRIPVGQGAAGRIAVSDRAMVIDDLAEVDAISPILRARVKSLVGAPLKVGDRLIGVLHAGSASLRRFTDADARLLTLAAERIAMAIDRARSHEAEQAAHREVEIASEQLRGVLQAGRMGTWQYTMATGDVQWSPGLEAIHGYAPGTFPGTFEAFQNEIHPADRSHVLSAISVAVEQRRDHQVEYRIVRPDGGIRWVEGRGQLFCDDEGRPERMVGVCADVTERKEAEERFRLAIEAAPTAMIMVNERGTIVLANALTDKMLGYERDEIVGRSIEQLVPSRFRDRHPHHRTSFLADARQRPMGAGLDLYALHKDGSEIPVEIGLSPIETADGLFVLAAVTDITARKQIDDERARLLVREQAARAETERASRLKDDFLAVLSHELRTPLNAVLGYAHLLSSGVLSAERAAHALDAIQRNAHAQARLVESLLDLSRIMAGKLELDREDVDLVSVVNAAVDVVRPDADLKEISLDVGAPAFGVSLVGDGGRLQQVFWNLLSNAVKFTPRRGRVAVRVVQDDSRVRIQVSDSGQGISTEFLPYVFDRFRQAETQNRRSPAGLGLGLALVREIVQAHGGTIVAESRGEGHGSTFTVALPFATGAVARGAAETSAPQADVVGALPQIEILVVDDDGDVRDLLAFLLESRGASARTVSSAQEALEAIGQRRPDVLLADLRMPDEDGFSLIRRVRAREREQQQERLPAIAVTAYASAHDREQAIAAGYDWHVAKPVEPNDLARAIVKVANAQNADSV